MARESSIGSVDPMGTASPSVGTLGLVKLDSVRMSLTKRCQAARLAIDATAKVAQVILALDHAVCDELGIAQKSP